MKIFSFLFLVTIVFLGVTAYELNRKGLLTREAFETYYDIEPERAEPISEIAEPVEMAAAIQEKKNQLIDETRAMVEMSGRLDASRRELEEQRILLERRIEELKIESARAAEPVSGNGARARQLGVSEETFKLIKMYETMPPEDAAEVLEGMSDSVVAGLLLKIRDRQAARIMESMDKEKASAVSRLLLSGEDMAEGAAQGKSEEESREMPVEAVEAP